MARTLDGRVVLEGGLVFDEPVHVGGMAEESGVDALHVRDGLDRHVIPGTSILGVVRQWLEDVAPTRFPELRIDLVFGGSDDSSSGASRLRIHDVVLEGMKAEVVDGVGIDRFTGTAAEGIKFDRAVLRQEAGGVSRFVLECEFGGAISSQDAELVATSVAAAMNSGILRLGAGSSRGLGGFRLLGINGDGVPRLGVETLDRQGILDRIAGRRRMDPIRSLPDVTGRDVTLTASVVALTPTFVKSSREGRLVDTFPRVVAKGGNAVLVIPGSSIKGVIRSELERQLRSVHGVDVHPQEPFHDQVRTPLVDVLFGYANGDATDQISSGYKGTVRFADLTGRIVGSSGEAVTWQEWSTVEDVIMSDKSSDPDADRQKLIKALQSAGLDAWQPTDHVAIDRWTSGVTDSKLFSVLEPFGVEWGSLAAEIDSARLERAEVNPLVAIAALLSMLQRLHDGAVGLGWGTHRGHGSMSVTSMSIQGLSEGQRVEIPSIGPETDLFSAVERVDSNFVAELRKVWSQEVAR